MKRILVACPSNEGGLPVVMTQVAEALSQAPYDLKYIQGSRDRVLDKVRFFTKLIFTFISMRPTIIISSHRGTDILLTALSLLVRSRVVITLHGLPYFLDEAQGLKGIINNFLWSLSLKRADRVVCVSRYSYSELVRCMPETATKASVIHNCLFPLLDRTSDWKSSPEPMIISCGRLVAVKNPQLFIQVAAASKAASKPYRFIWYGDGPLLNFCRGLVKDYDLTDIISFPGSAPWTSTVSLNGLYLHTCKIEGFGLSCLESMAIGLPVIGPAAGALPELIPTSEHGILLDKTAFQPEEILEQIDRLLSVPPLYQTIRFEANKRACTEFSFSKFSNNYIKLIESL